MQLQYCLRAECCLFLEIENCVMMYDCDNQCNTREGCKQGGVMKSVGQSGWSHGSSEPQGEGDGDGDPSLQRPQPHPNSATQLSSCRCLARISPHSYSISAPHPPLAGAEGSHLQASEVWAQGAGAIRSFGFNYGLSTLLIKSLGIRRGQGFEQGGGPDSREGAPKP